MRKVLLSLAVLAWAAAPVLAAVGETWTLMIHTRHTSSWVEYPGAGYEGTSAWEGVGWHGERRVYWELSGTGSMGNEPPTEPRLYTIEFWAPTEGGTDWQPIESALDGVVDGETYPYESDILWAGQYGTNHQWIGSDGANDGQWHETGPGPQVPESDDYDAGGNGIYMWLDRDSGLYAKWDFGWPITRAWSAIRLTQITGPGACCLPDLTCEQLEPDECAAQDGEYQGNLTSCDDPEVRCCPDPFADVDQDTDVDQEDFGFFQVCYTGQEGDPIPSEPLFCKCFDYLNDDWQLGQDGDIDGNDLQAFEACASGPGIAADDTCDDVPPP